MPATPSQPTTTVPTAIAGRYQIKHFIGEGARKRVYLARDSRLDRDVALALIKTEGLDDEGLARLRREAQSMGALGDHPHIVTIHDTGESDLHPYIVSQYMEGGSIADVLARAEGHRLPCEEALRIADQVCQALEYAHARGVIHRDLKPANVWLTADGTAKLGDFGLAMALDRSRLSMEGMMVGTVAYMPPEQATGRGADARSDLYSLGVVLYEMLCGCPPFIGSDAVAIISQHINTPPLAPSWHNPAIPRETEALILQLLAKAPEERPASASVVRERLRHAMSAPAEQFVPATAAASGFARLASGPFIGRQHELAILRSGVEGALGGQGSMVMIAGEPGMGKTRLAEEAGVYARLRGAQVLVGRCYEGEGAPAFWPWVQVIRSYVHDCDPRTLISDMGQGAADIAQVVSDVRERLPGLPSPAHVEPEQARFRLFDSVTAFMKNAAHRQPVALILDDLQWADKPSLLLLQFLVRELRGSRIFVMGTYQDVRLDRRHPLSEVLATLGRERPYERIHLAGLSADEVKELLEAVAQHGLEAEGRAFARALHRETEGNPFFVQEIIRHLVETGRIFRVHAEWKSDAATVEQLGISDGVREVIGRRVSRLSELCGGVLTVAAVIGREFDVDILQLVTQLSDDALLEALDEALSSRVVLEVSGTVGRYRFSHALLRQALYDELTSMRRVRLHRRIGEVLEQLYTANMEPHLAELAYHFLEGAQHSDIDRVVDYGRRAGKRAIKQLAYEDAVTHYGRALQALDRRSPADELERCELVLAVGDAQWRAGDVRNARRTFSSAVETARGLGKAELLARAALGYGMGLGGFGFADKADKVLLGFLEEALNALGESDSALRARVMARLAVELYYTNAREKRAALSEQAVQMAQRLGDKAVQLVALYSWHKAMQGPNGHDERLQAADQMLRLAAEAGDDRMAFLSHHFRVSALLELGDTRAADVEIEHCEQIARALRQPVYLWQTRVLQAMRATMGGRLEEGKSLAEEALSLGRDVQGDMAQVHFGVQLFYYHFLVGRLEAIEDAVRSFSEQYRSSGWDEVLALAWVELGKEEEARAQLERVASNGFADISRDGNWLSAMAALSWVCARLNDPTHAGVLREHLLPYTGRIIVTGAGALCFGSVHGILGLLAATMARWQEAIHHFESALEQQTTVGDKPTKVMVLHEYARALLSRDAHGDREHAVKLINEALDGARELGMNKLIERLLALKLQVQGVPSGQVTNSIYAVALAVQRERPDLRSHMAPDGTVTILFSDIEGFTAMIERLGDRSAHEVLRTHNALVREQVAAHRGFEVKSEGDGFMLAFSSARRGLDCAIATQRALAEHNRQYPEMPITVRMGLHTGEAIAEADDFFGRTVITASRIAGLARGGEILVSSVLKQLTDSGGDIAFDDGRQVVLKGLNGTHCVHGVSWAPAGDAPAAGPGERGILGRVR